MSQGRWNDLYDRLTSRKFLLTLLTIGFAVWGYQTGQLTAVQFQQAVTAALISFTVPEALSDAAGRWQASTPAPVPPGDTQTVVVSSAPSSPPPTGSGTVQTSAPLRRPARPRKPPASPGASEGSR